MLSLLIFLPVLILFLAALAILILQQARPSIGYAWLIGALSSLVAAGLVLFLRWYIPLELVAEQWRVFAERSTPPAFRLDQFSWPYMFSLAVLVLAFILTDAARLEKEARPTNWAVGLTISGVGMLAVMASNAVTLMMIWTALDVVEFLMLMSTSAGRRLAEQTILVFAVRVAGTLLVLVAVLVGRSQNSADATFALDAIPSGLAIFMLLAAGLRLGVLPLNLLYVREIYTWRGLGNVMRMVGPASSLVVLGRLPGPMTSLEWTPLLLWLSALAAAYGSVMWLTSENELIGRPYWSTALAAMAVASVLDGQPRASIAWGMALILSGGTLFFFSARQRSIMFIPLLGVLGIIGLPYNPAAAGWDGVAGRSASALLTFFFVLTVLCLVWGYIRHALRPRDELYRMERWVHTVYPLGLVFLVLGQWAAGALSEGGLVVPRAWWAPLVVLLLGGLGAVLAYSLRSRFNDETITGRWLGVAAHRSGVILGAFFGLNWLYSFIAWVYSVVQGTVHLLTDVLEGDGGILWSMVMLALLISLIVTGIQP